MTDYLTHLSARSFGLDPGSEWVQPRLPSLFEPWPEPKGMPMEMPPWPPATDGDRDPRPSPAAAIPVEASTPRRPVPERPRAETPAAVPPSAEIMPRPPDPEPASAHTIRHHRKEVRPELTAPLPAPPRPTPRSDSSPEAPGEPGVAPDARPKTAVVPAEIRSNARLTVQPVVKPAETARFPTEPAAPEKNAALQPERFEAKEREIKNTVRKEHFERIVEGNAATKEKAPTSPEGLSPETVKPVYHPPAPVLPAWAARDRRRERETPEPVIQVTIGRIEVRATSTPAPRRPRQKAPSAMSLDEYLRRRNGDRR